MSHNIITIWRTSAIEVNALLKIHVQKWKICKKKNPSWVWGVDRKIHTSGSLSGLTRLAEVSLVMPDSDTRDGFFYLSLTPMIDSYSLTWAFCISESILGPVVQSVVSLTSLLRVISLTVLADSIHNILILFVEKMWVAFAQQKLLTFFQQKISAYLPITRCKF